MTWPPIDYGVRRTMDARFLNEVANHPDVRPWLGGDGVLDLTAQLQQSANLAGVTDQGGFVALALGAGRYEIHSLFLPSRGVSACRAMRGALDYLFSATDAVELVTKVPEDNLAARGLARLAGFRPSFTSVLPWTSTTRKPITVQRIDLETWALRSAACLTMGQWLHTQFAAMIAAQASTWPPHSPEDDAHDRMAGAATLMIRAGNIAKAVTFYNQWATLTGYAPMRWIRQQPTRLDLDGLIVEIVGDEIEVLACP